MFSMTRQCSAELCHVPNVTWTDRKYDKMNKDILFFINLAVCSNLCNALYCGDNIIVTVQYDLILSLPNSDDKAIC